MLATRYSLLRPSRIHMRHLRLEVYRETVNVAGAHNQRMVAHEVLEIVNFAVVRAVCRVRAHDFSLLPVRLKIILRHAATMTLRSERERARHVVLRMRCG